MLQKSFENAFGAQQVKLRYLCSLVPHLASNHLPLGVAWSESTSSEKYGPVGSMGRATQIPLDSHLQPSCLGVPSHRRTPPSTDLVSRGPA